MSNADVNRKRVRRISMPLLGMRILEITLSEIIVSVITAGICEMFAADGVKPEALLMLTGFILLVIYNVRCLAAYMDFAKSLGTYYSVNLTAMLIFSVICMGVLALDFEIINKIFFFPYGLFTLAGKPMLYSFLGVSCIMYAIIFVIPFVLPVRER